jgi:ribonuclease D
MERLLADIANCREIAVDTEADSYYSYHEKVCLLQVSTPSEDYIVDPLSECGIEWFAPVMASPTVMKVFHDAEYDVQLMKSAGLPHVERIFDTRVAVSLLGVKAPGLASVLKDLYGIELDKSLQRSDWSRRPLTRQQLEYARHDTRHLLRLASDISHRLRTRGVWDLFLFECDRVASTPPREKKFSPDDCIHIRGAERLRPHELSVFKELVAQREEVARRADVAPFRVISNDWLLHIATLAPRTPQQLDSIRELPRALKQQFGQHILAAVDRALRAGPWTPPRRNPPPPEDQLAATERLKKWRTRKAEELNMDSSGILNRHTLEFLARHRPGTADGIQNAPGLAPWQYAKFGAELLQMMAELNSAFGAPARS